MPCLDGTIVFIAMALDGFFTIARVFMLMRQLPFALFTYYTTVFFFTRDLGAHNSPPSVNCFFT
jgi:hypothetical protein